MEEFVIVTRDFLGVAENEFCVDTIKAKDSDKAWEIVEESYATNNSQEWLLDLYEFRALKNLINSVNIELLESGKLRLVKGKRK